MKRSILFVLFPLTLMVPGACLQPGPSDSGLKGTGGRSSSGAPSGGASQASGGGLQSGVGGSPGSGGGESTSNGTGGGVSLGGTGGFTEASGSGGSMMSERGGTGGNNGPGTPGTGGRGTGGTNVPASGGMSGAGGMGTGGMLKPGPGEPLRLTSGNNGWGSRYWDCCKPACGWKANVRSGNPITSCSKDNQNLGSYDTKNACEGGGSAYMCWSQVPWSISDTMSYGFAAASAGNYVCGRCYQVQFTGAGHNGTDAGATSLNGKSMIVQVINNGGVASDQMDLLIPGGGVGALNACSSQWGSANLGSQYGGFAATCKNDKTCIQQMCTAAFAGKADLQAGCDWFLNWFNAADNPAFLFKQIACPAAITQKSGLQDPG